MVTLGSFLYMPNILMGSFTNLLIMAFVVVSFPLYCGSLTTAAPMDQASGQRLFAVRCSLCHGKKGEGGRGPGLAVPKFVRASTDKSLIEIIRDGIPGTEMQESGLDVAQIKQIIAYIRQVGRRSAGPVPGNRRIGEQLYWGKGGCKQCHVLKGQGTAIGPDLTDIGAHRGVSYLRTSLTDPEADVPKGVVRYRTEINIPTNFLQVHVRSRDGQNIFGVRVNEDTFSIQVRDLSGHTYSFFKAELAELDKQWGKSPMPSYRGIFSKEELDDMTAFLASLRGNQ
jgi:cytochrome c oxidase cbb3-type subunit 3